MTHETTLTTSRLAPEREVAVADARPYLVLIATPDVPEVASARHLLDDVDEVRFGRGPNAAIRTGRTLELRVPDPRMSSDHGKLVRGLVGWVLDDPQSKNGAVVDGAVTRRAILADGTIFELGHTFFALCIAGVEGGASPDLVVEAAAGVLTTFEGGLADALNGLRRIAPTSVSVVILGETGTGKELIARALHELSRRPGEFTAVNCGALPASLIEAELFGHRRGAFTGAVSDRPGLVRSADGGTLFLDEIGELPPASQAAFLRVLQEREVTPVGGDRPVKVDVRLCAATLRELPDMVERGEFRSDLYARLFGYTLVLPPLRERWVDFGILLRTLLARIGEGRALRVTPAALRLMLRHEWPFNIRELHTTLATAAALADDIIDLAQLPRAMRHPPTSSAPTERAEPARPQLSPEDVELRDRLIGVLTAQGGNVVNVSRELGARRTQIYRWAHRFGLDLDAFRV